MKLSSCILLTQPLISYGFVSLGGLPGVAVTRMLSTTNGMRDVKTTSEAAAAADTLGLTPELAKITNAFEAIGDDKLRYKQLLYMAGQLAPLNKASMTPENKVMGCLSTVYVDGKVVFGGDNNDERRIEFTGDSDGLLTKGLVALLVRGLSGNTAEQIQKVDPAFIKKAGIQSSLTPGRNNGFLNMLATMKRKALQLDAQATEIDREPIDNSGASAAAGSDTSTSAPSASGRPIYDAVVSSLLKLQPTSLELTDVSHRHSGHAGMGGQDAVESHFELNIVADAFDGLNLVKRHKLIYMLLGEIMPNIHALQICALTPQESEARK